MARKTWIGAVVITASALAACTATDLSSRSNTQDTLLPPGVAKGAPLVDPLVVGDRLMAAQEFEMAMQAYIRAAEQRGLTHEVRSSIASANLSLGRLRQAESEFRTLVTEQPESYRDWNNLGVVLLEKGEYGEANRILRKAFALSSGQSPEIRENLKVALAKIEKPSYDDGNNIAFTLNRYGGGVYRLRSLN